MRAARLGIVLGLIGTAIDAGGGQLSAVTAPDGDPLTVIMTTADAARNVAVQLGSIVGHSVAVAACSDGSLTQTVIWTVVVGGGSYMDVVQVAAEEPVNVTDSSLRAWLDT